MLNPFFFNKTVLITAGPTREAIDPVRYISNHSSGKMGYAITEAFLDAGAKVILVSGPVNLELSHKNLVIIPVISALDMHAACESWFERIDIAVFAAAVADYRPKTISNNKIKKLGEQLELELIKNPDISFEFGKVKRCGQISVGFALETQNEIAYALDKLYKKNFDLIVLNSPNDNEAAFGFDTNKVTILNRRLEKQDFELKAKSAVAIDILDEIAAFSDVLKSGKRGNYYRMDNTSIISNEAVVYSSVITCPVCGFHKTEQMPADACRYFYQCDNCRNVIRPKKGDCCVFCSYGNIACPSMQLDKSCC